MILNSPDKNTSKLLFFSLLLLVFAATAYFHPSTKANADARFAHLRALVEFGEHRIDHWPIRSQDVVRVEGVVYSNKPPGIVYVAYPVWLVADKVFELNGVTGQKKLQWLSYLSILCLSGLSHALTTALLFLVLCRMLGSNSKAIALSLFYGIGSVAYPFASLFFSHSFSAFCLFASFSVLFFLDDLRERIKNVFWLYVLLVSTGALASYAFCSEYQALIGTGFVALYGLTKIRNKKEFLFFTLGGTAGLIPTLLYNWDIFGSPFSFSYGVKGGRANPNHLDHNEGFLGLGFLRFDRFWRSTFGSYRGLFYVNPWLVASLAGAFYSFKQKRYRLESVACTFCFLAFLAFVSSLKFYGGGTLGPRYLLPGLPFAVIAVAAVLNVRIIKAVVYTSGVVSVCAMVAALATKPRPGERMSNPLFELFIPRYLNSCWYRQGKGPFGDASLFNGSASFNWGTIADLPLQFQVLPLLLALALSVPLFYKIAARADNKALSLNNWIAISVTSLTLVGFALLPAYHANKNADFVAKSHSMSYKKYTGSSKDLEEVLRTNGQAETDKLQLLDSGKFSETLLCKDPVERKDASFAGRYSEWSTTLVVPKTGTYRFAVMGHRKLSGVLLLDGKPVFDTRSKPRPFTAMRRSLKAGSYPLLFKYSNRAPEMTVQLMWKGPEDYYFSPINGSYLKE